MIDPNEPTVLLTFTMQIMIEKSTKNVLEDHIREIFSVYGTISSVDFPMNSAEYALILIPTVIFMYLTLANYQ